jgi:hypothetical protein
MRLDVLVGAHLCANSASDAEEKAGSAFPPDEHPTSEVVCVKPDRDTFDRDLALSYLGGEEELFLDLATRFHESAPALVHRMRGAREPREAAHAADALQGMALQIGARATSEAAADVIRAARANDGTTPGKIQRLSSRITALFRVLPRRARKSINAR